MRNAKKGHELTTSLVNCGLVRFFPKLCNKVSYAFMLTITTNLARKLVLLVLP